MITYLYWLLAAAVIFATLFGVGVRLNQWKIALGLSLILLAIASGLYYFRFEQMFVKRWGGTMSISVPDGQQHITATWKDDNLWVENYDPEKDVCIFSEYSRGNVLQGQVKINDCNPLHAIGRLPSASPAPKP